MPLTRLRGTTTYPRRNYRAIQDAVKRIPSKENFRIADIGPGMAWKRIVRFLPPEKARKGRVIRDTIAKYADRIARKFLRAPNHFTLFEPFEIAEAVHSEKGKRAKFTITIIDNKDQTNRVLRNDTRFQPTVFSFSKKDITKHAIPPNDLIIAINVLAHADRTSGLRNIMRGLEQGGMVLINRLTPEEVHHAGLTRIAEYERGIALYRKGEY